MQMFLVHIPDNNVYKRELSLIKKGDTKICNELSLYRIDIKVKEVKLDGFK